ELVYVDITREGSYDMKRNDHKESSRSDILSILRDIASRCFMPLTFGGRIRSLEVVDQSIANGADKVVINTGIVLEPALITQVASKILRTSCKKRRSRLSRRGTYSILRRTLTDGPSRPSERRDSVSDNAMDLIQRTTLKAGTFLESPRLLFRGLQSEDATEEY